MVRPFMVIAARKVNYRETSTRPGTGPRVRQDLGSSSALPTSHLLGVWVQQFDAVGPCPRDLQR
jgi:hypothetical protein